MAAGVGVADAVGVGVAVGVAVAVAVAVGVIVGVGVGVSPSPVPVGRKIGGVGVGARVKVARIVRLIVRRRRAVFVRGHAVAPLTPNEGVHPEKHQPRDATADAATVVPHSTVVVPPTIPLPLPTRTSSVQ